MNIDSAGSANDASNSNGVPTFSADRSSSAEDSQAASAEGRGASKAVPPEDPLVRAENEDDDGYDPYSDRRPEPEPLFEENPWG